MAFDRGLDSHLVQFLAGQPKDGWWGDILKHNGLCLALRKNSIHVYSNGQRIFNISISKDRLESTIHYKYLQGYTDHYYRHFDGANFDTTGLESISRYESSSTLDRLIGNAKVYAGQEKTAVHTILASRSNTNVIDVEIAFNTPTLTKSATQNSGDVSSAAEDEMDQSELGRLDLATLEKRPDGDDISVVFYEVKMFDDARLRSRRDVAEVVSQIKRYERAVKFAEADILASYKRVCRNIVSLRRSPGRPGRINALVSAIAETPDRLRVDPKPRLIIVGYSADQWNGPNWQPQLERLAGTLGVDRVIGWGAASAVTIGPERLHGGRRFSQG